LTDREFLLKKEKEIEAIRASNSEDDFCERSEEE
jgi:hypothetical protein